MMSTLRGARLCPVTSEPLPDDRYISKRGVERYENACSALPGIMEALEAIKAGAVRRGPQVVVRAARAGSRPACVLGVMAAAQPHERTLTAWAQHIAARKSWAHPRTWDQVARTLMGAAKWVGDVETAECVPQVLAAIRALSAMVEPPPGEKFWGRCLTTVEEGGVCDYPIYAPADASWARCPACDSQWELRGLLEDHLGVAADYLVTPAEGAALLAQVGVATTASTIRSWKKRGKLVARDGRYRIGDLLAATS